MDESGRWARVEGNPSLEIGVINGPAEYMFWPLSAAVEGPGGHIVIIDGDTREIRIFSETGEFRGALGGRGGGPGEFRAAPAIRLIPPDTVLAWDREMLRLTWFTFDGTVVREASLAPISDSGPPPFANIWMVHPSGVVVGQRGVSSGRHEGLNEEPQTFVIVHPNSSTIARIEGLPGHPEMWVGDAGAPAVLHPTAGGGNWALRVSPPSLIVSDDPAGAWSLGVYDFEGELRGVIRMAVRRREATDEVARTARSWLLDLMPPDLRHADQRAAVERMPIPDLLPSISSVMVADGRIWVRRWRGMWEEGGNDIFDVLDGQGRWRGWVSVPRRFGRIMSIGSDYILFEWRNDEGVPVLHRHRLVEP